MSKPVLGLLAGLAVVSAAPMLLARRGGRNVAPDVAALQRLLAHLRALRWQYHTTHWQSKGPNFYGDHLLFERLYAGEGGGPDLDAEIDGLGERMTRFFGAETVDDSAILPLTTAILAAAGSEREPIRRAMALETATHEAIDHAYEALAASGHKTLGLDDFLMALADERDTAAYLLGQRLDAPPRFPAKQGQANRASGCGCGSKNKAGSRGSSNCTCGSIR